MSSRTARAGTLLALIVVTTIGAGLAPLATAPSGAGSMDSGFVEYMEPRLLALLESAREVEGMVSEHSRNILALRAESERIMSLIEQINGYLADRELSPDEEYVADLYLSGSASLRRAIGSAYDALSSFDFSAMPDMIPVFSKGTRLIQEALTSLRTVASTRSSYTCSNAR